MPPRPVAILGAGATKACGGPLTNEILPRTFEMQDIIEREGFLHLLDEFLMENFHLPPHVPERKREDYPGLPLLLSLLDTAIDRKQPFGPNWRPDRLVYVRDALEYAVFAVIDYQLRQSIPPYHHHLLDALRNVAGEPRVISLNYDIIVDNALADLMGTFPDYRCDIQTEVYRNGPPRFGALLKLHGSLNWLYCPACHRLDIGASEHSGHSIKVLNMLYQDSNLNERYGCHGSPCRDCGAFVRPVLITPTHRKDYRNPHVAQVWYQAERTLREADRAIFIGYSLPEDDVEVVYLLKRGLAHLPPDRITVVEFDPQGRPLRDHPVGSRYRTLFGDGLEWRTDGFEGWLGSGPVV